LLIGCALGAGVAYGLHLLRPVVGSARSLSKLTGLPVLGVVSVAFPRRVSLAVRRDRWQFAAGLMLLFGAFALALVLNWSGVRLISSSTGVG
jgi:hypothetical protein